MMTSGTTFTTMMKKEAGKMTRYHGNMGSIDGHICCQCDGVIRAVARGLENCQVGYFLLCIY